MRGTRTRVAIGHLATGVANERPPGLRRWVLRPLRRHDEGATLLVVDVPTTHADLLDRALPAALTTHLDSGRLQSSVVWYRRDGEGVRLSTMTEFAKARNLRARPRATLLVWDTDGRWLELRADAAQLPQSPREALAECDDMGARYCGLRPYFGAVVAAEWAEREHPVTFRLAPAVICAGTSREAAWGGARQRADDEPAAPDADEVPLPASHLDLAEGPSVRLLATADPNGRARVRPVAGGLVEGRAVVAVDDEQRADLARDARATLLVVDRADSARWMEVRVDVLAVRRGGAMLGARRVVLDAIHR